MWYGAQTGIWRLASRSGADRTVKGLASSLVEESGYLAVRNRRDEACAKVDEGVALMRGLGPSHRPTLARFLVTAAEHHRFAGRPDAIDLLDEAAALAQEADGPDWGPVLRSIGNALWQVGRHADGVATCRRAVDLLRSGPAVELGSALTALGMVLKQQGQLDEALAAHREAIEVFRPLNPFRSAVQRTFAEQQLALTLGAAGRYREALSAARDPLFDLAATAKFERGVTAAWYASLIKAVAYWHSELGEADEALTAAQRAIALFRGLIAGGIAPYVTDLAAVLSIEARQLHRLGRDSEAVPPLREAIEIWRAQPDSDRHLVWQLASLASRLWDLDQPAESIALSREVIELFRRLAADNPDKYAHQLPVHLAKLTNRTDEPGHLVEALGLARGLADRDPHRHAGLRCDLIVQYAVRHDPPEAIAPLLEAIALTRPYVDQFARSLAIAFCVIAGARLEMGQPVAAVDALAELTDLTFDEPEIWDLVEEALAAVRDEAPDEVERRGLADALRRP